MNLNLWTMIATLLGVLIYIALPVALAVIYLSRVSAALGRNKPSDGAEGKIEGGDA